MSDAFPADFTFGVATSAYQVEGGIENDWSDWEAAGKLKDPHARCGLAVDHWNRFDADVDLIERLGATAYRLSLEWARVEPSPGRFDDAALQGYRRRLETLSKRGIRPVVTLHHFTHPRWFPRDTPWHESASLASWTRYVKEAAQLFVGLDVVVCTLNEPNVFLMGGYLAGLMPPGLKDPGLTWAACQNLCRAHVLARELVKAVNPAAPVGLAQHLMVFAAARAWNPIDQALSRLAEDNFNHAILEALTTGELKVRFPGFVATAVKLDGAARSMDYLGVNYYTRAHLKFLPGAPWAEYVFKDPNRRGLTDIGWERYPEGFAQVLKQLARYHLPIWVTENGLDDRSGEKRPEFLHQHWKALLEARAAGADVRAYLHWSLLDNFEWLEAWGPQFGLYRVDRKTLERTETPACAYFRRVATSKVLTAP